MSDAITLIALFEDFEPASEGIEKLQELGVEENDMNVISGIPIKNTILGRPSPITYVSRMEDTDRNTIGQYMAGH